MSKTPPAEGFAYRFVWNRMDRKGQLCKVLIRGKTLNSCLVEFEDGYKAVTSRNALRRADRESNS